MPGACGLRPCARTHHKKGLVPHLPVGWGGQQIPQINLGLNLSRCRVALQSTVLYAARIWLSVSRYLEISFGFKRPSPSRAFTPVGGLSPGVWGTPKKENTDGAVGIFGNAGRMCAPPLHPDPPKKPCATLARLVGRPAITADHYRCNTNSTRLLTFSM